MKRFWKWLLNGIKQVFVSLVTVSCFVLAGIFFYETATTNGYGAVGNFFGGIVSLTVAICALVCIGAWRDLDTPTEKGGD